MKHFILIIALFISSQVVQAAEKKINDELQRGLDGRSKVDQITDDELADIALQAIMRERYGVTPEQLKRARELAKQEEEAFYDNEPAKMIKEVISVSTDPSAQSPTIYTTPGHSTFVNVIDRTGQPWPLVIASSGNESLFTVSPVESHEFKNVFKLGAQYRVGSSNLTLLLTNKPLSITVKVVSSKDKYHPQPILQIAENGPLAKQSKFVSANIPIRNNKLMMDLIYELAPDDLKKVKTDNSGVVAWRKEGRLFIKSKLIPFYPRADSVYPGANGYATFEIAYLPEIVMVDNNGIQHQVTVFGD